MNRAIQFLADAWREKDLFSLGLATALLSIAFWLLSMPFSPFVQISTINRFHLTTDSFSAWVFQQPIPPMYNLENQFWYSTRPLNSNELENKPAADVKTEMVNHFPARMITCASGRLIMLENQTECWFYLKSRYQSSERITTYRLERMPSADGLHLKLVGDGEDL